MKNIGIKELTLDNFRKFGMFINLIDPDTEMIGEKPIEFFRDMALLSLGQCNQPSISVCRVQTRPNIIDKLEFHSSCGEANLPLDGDILLQLAPASPDKQAPYDKIEVFHVPKGTLIVLNYGVWHHAPYTYNCGAVNMLAILPERTYASDCYLFEFPENEKIKINNNFIK